MTKPSTKRRAKMVCPECKTEMNLHAAKVIEPRSAEEAALADAALGGLVEEMHWCRDCGTGASRRAS